jgi:hypothetical protein
MADETFTKADLDAAVEKAVAKVQESIDKLESKNAELLDEAKKAKAELRKVKDISPEDMAALEAERDKLASDLAEANKALKAATADKEKATKALETESAFTQKLLISDGLKSALIANGVKDEDFIDSLTAKFAGGASIKIDGDSRVAMFGDKPLADHIKEWAGSDAGKKFVAAPVNSGGGAGGGDGKGGGGKTVDRATFDSMSQPDRMKFSADGGKVVDQAA